jgi:GMP synthase-like glutamine amidotransferase
MVRSHGMATEYVEFVVTEHLPAITAALARHYEAVRKQLERLAGVPVHSQHYCDPVGFADARALILSGSFAPWALHDEEALARLGERVGRFDRAVLGICAGMQLQTLFAGGGIGRRERPALGYQPVEVLDQEGLLDGLGANPVAYQHHYWEVVTLPEDFVVVARSEDCGVEAVRSPSRNWWGTQFHPERFSARHPAGERVLRNFFSLAGVGAGTPGGETARRGAGGSG